MFEEHIPELLFYTMEERHLVDKSSYCFEKITNEGRFFFFFYYYHYHVVFEV